MSAGFDADLGVCSSTEKLQAENDWLLHENARLFDEAKYLRASNAAWERMAIEMQRELDEWRTEALPK